MMYLIGSAITLVALTLCISISTMCFRMLREKREKPAFEQGQVAVLAGSIALFGILITGVFFITAFRMDQTARSVAESVAKQVAQDSARDELSRLTRDARTLRDTVISLAKQHKEILASSGADSTDTSTPNPSQPEDRNLTEELFDNTGDVIEEAVEDVGDLGEEFIDEIRGLFD